MRWTGHTEFGPNYVPIYNKKINFKIDLDINHWIEQWYFIYNHAFQLLKNKQNVHFVSYERLCSTKDYWLQIQEIAKIEEIYDFEFRESKKDIPCYVDTRLQEKVMNLYFDLNGLNLN